MLEIILIIVLILLLAGGGTGYYRGYWAGPGYPAVGGFLVLVLIIVLLVWLLAPFPYAYHRVVP